MGHKPRRAVRPKRGGWIREIVLTLIVALTISTLARVFVVQVFEIPSGSMENTLLVGDRVAVQKIKPFKRGDIVVFKDSQGWLGDPPPKPSPGQSVLQFLGFAPDQSANFLIKRAIGLPGDSVKCCDSKGRLSVNGHPLEESQYLFVDAAGRMVEPSDLAFDVVVPQGHIFAMGDHRNNSQDSRCYLDPNRNGPGGDVRAFIPLLDVQGTAAAVVLPFARWQTFSTPTMFDNVPEPKGRPPAVGVVNAPVPVC